jgi:hypothetical protein
MSFRGPMHVLAVVYNDSDYSTPGVRGFSGD